MNRTKVKELQKRAEEIVTELETLRDDEQAEWDERSERWQDGDRGQEAQQAIDTLDEAASAMQDAATTLDEVL